MNAQARAVWEQRSSAWTRLFVGYIKRLMSRRFAAVRIARDGLPRCDRHGPLLVYSNHPSWWDPLMYLLLQDRCFPETRGFGPMEAAAFRRYGYMRRFGVFSVDNREYRGAARFLRIADGLLSRPDAALWITAQGQFADPRLGEINLRPGIAHLARRHPRLQLVPLALEYPFWNEARPEALCSFGPAIPARSLLDMTVPAVTDCLANRLQHELDRLARHAQQRDPVHFLEIIGSRAATGREGVLSSRSDLALNR